jgi:hypothetical protein
VSSAPACGSAGPGRRLFRLSNKLFLGSIVAMLLWTLIRHRKQDSYRDNYFFLLILPAFLVAKHLMLDGRAVPRWHRDGDRHCSASPSW